MDYQPGILARLEIADQLIATVADAIAAVRDRGGQVAYVRVAFTDEDLAQMPEHSQMASRVTPALHADAPETQVDHRLAPEDGEIVVRKVRVGAFSTTDLDAQLRERRIDTIVLAGISTSGVVLSTVRDGADRDYRVIVLSDGCADPEPDIHEFLITRVLPKQAQIITTGQLQQLISVA